jgi:hypothetical protein
MNMQNDRQTKALQCMKQRLENVGFTIAEPIYGEKTFQVSFTTNEVGDDCLEDGHQDNPTLDKFYEELDAVLNSDKVGAFSSVHVSFPAVAFYILSVKDGKRIVSDKLQNTLTFYLTFHSKK